MKGRGRDGYGIVKVTEPKILSSLYVTLLYIFFFFKSITLSSLDKLDESLSIIERILLAKSNTKYNIDKKIFKMTLCYFKNSLSKQTSCNKDIANKFELICEQINNDNQLNEIDLFEMTTEYNLKLKREDENELKPKSDECSKARLNEETIREIEKLNDLHAQNNYLEVTRLFRRHFLSDKNEEVLKSSLGIYINSLIHIVNFFCLFATFN